MTTETIATASLTSDPVAPEQLRADIAKLFDMLAGGGFGIVPLDVAYAVVATTPGGIRRIFEAKRRSYDKPSGMFGNWRMSRDAGVFRLICRAAEGKLEKIDPKLQGSLDQSKLRLPASAGSRAAWALVVSDAAWISC